MSTTPKTIYAQFDLRAIASKAFPNAAMSRNNYGLVRDGAGKSIEMPPAPAAPVRRANRNRMGQLAAQSRLGQEALSVF